MDELQRFLNSLGIPFNKRDTPSFSKSPQQIPIPNCTEINNRYGTVYRIHEFIPGAKEQIVSEIPAEIIKWLKTHSNVDPLALNDFFFVDVETSGDYGLAGVLCFLIGIGKLDQNGIHLSQYLILHPEDEFAQLWEVEKAFLTAKGLITYNGKSFDLPLLQSRFQYHHIPLPLQDLIHIDLLHLSRKIYKNHPPNRALKSMEAKVLGVERKVEDIPGWMIPSIYRDFLLTQDFSFLLPILYHNKMDVTSLVYLYDHTVKLITELEKPSTNIEICFNIADFFVSIGNIDRAIAIYQNCWSAEMEEGQEIVCLEKLGGLYKKQKLYDQANHYWHEAAKKGSLIAHNELIKYHLREKNLSSARFWAQKAQCIIETKAMDRFDRMKWQAELKILLARLDKAEENYNKKRKVK